MLEFSYKFIGENKNFLWQRKSSDYRKKRTKFVHSFEIVNIFALKSTAM
jgi:hypothetical protein